MGDADETELAPTETETASVYAWGLDDEDTEDYPSAGRFSSRTITAAAVTASVAVVVAAVVVAWQHLRRDQPVDTAASSSMVPAIVPTPLTSSAAPVAAPPPPAPAPPPVTITTVVVQAPTTTAASVPVAEVLPTYAGISPEVMASYDRQFVDRMRAAGWRIDDPELMALRARQVCLEFAQGNSRESIDQKLAALGSFSLASADTFTSVASMTYPSCP